MVKIHIKNVDTSQFLYETTVDEDIDILIKELVAIYNGRLKIERLCGEIEELAKHGTMLPPNMIGLTEEQVQELKLVDEWAEICVPSGGAIVNKDPIGRRNGKAPNSKMAEVLQKTITEAKALVTKKLVEQDKCLTQANIFDALSILKGAVAIVYPMGLPPHDPVRMELENREELEGTQASLEVIPEEEACLWWAGKELLRGKKLKDYVGRNEKTKIVAKIHKKGKGAPAREPVISEEERKQLMLMAYRREEELKKLEEMDDDDYLNSSWADNRSLQRSFHGLKDIKWKP